MQMKEKTIIKDINKENSMKTKKIYISNYYSVYSKL